MFVETEDNLKLLEADGKTSIINAETNLLDLVYI